MSFVFPKFPLSIPQSLTDILKGNVVPIGPAALEILNESIGNLFKTLSHRAVFLVRYLKGFGNKSTMDTELYQIYKAKEMINK